jgi:hypothetical protein
MKQYLLSRLLPLLVGTLAILVSFVTASEALIVTLAGQASGGKVSQLAIAGMGKVGKEETVRGVATAVRDTKSDNLKVAVWRITRGDPNVVLWAENAAGPIDKVAIASLTPTRLVTANRAGEELRVIVWDFQPGVAQLERRGFAPFPGDSPTNQNVAITSLSDSRVLTAHFGQMIEPAMLTVWEVDASGNIQERSTAVWHKPITPDSEIAITRLPNGQVAVAAQDANNLWVSLWDVDALGMPQLKAEGSVGLGPVPLGNLSSLGITSYGKTGVVTASLNKGQVLRFILWDGGLKQVSSSDFGDTGKFNKVAVPPDSFLALTTAFHTQDYLVTLSTWYAEAGFHYAGGCCYPNSITMLNKGSLAVTSWLENPQEATVIAAIQDEHGKLKLIVWSIQLEPG